MRDKRFVAVLALTAAAALGAVSGVQAQSPARVPEAPGPDPNDAAESDPAFQELSDDGMGRAWRSQDVESKLDAEALATDFPDVWAGSITDYDAGTYTVQYDADADQSHVDEFLAKVEAAQDLEPGLRIVPKKVDFSTAKTDAVMNDLTADLTGWAERLGVPDIVGMGPDGATAEIVIYTSGDINRDVTEVVGWPSRIQGNVDPGPATQVSRWTDSKPISGGRSAR
ncbi:MAG: hypothetical protein LBK95_08635 [Bifidobacteriaceae bacterium]|nr:hypothetical protein [Bifidobacteriaceae bacterium]